MQPSLTVTHSSGFYADVWGSNIAESGGAEYEADLSVGWSGDLGKGTAVDVYAMYYACPQASGLNYAEVGVSLSQAVGEGSIAAELSYAPAQEGTNKLDWMVGAEYDLAKVSRQESTTSTATAASFAKAVPG